MHTGKWTEPVFVADPYIRIHGMAPALNYGQQAYEGLKAFRAPGDGAITVFRPDRNAKRMQHSAEFISCPPVPDELFLAAVKAAVALNAEFVPPHETGAALYIRPQIYGSSAQLGLSPPEEYAFCVFVVPTGVYHGSHPVKALILDEFDRAAPNGTGSAKVGGNYAPVLRWSDRARTQGYGITLHLDSKSHEEVDEFSTSGFIGALAEGDQVTLVVPDTKNAIKSVTSESIQEIGRSWGWKVEQRPVSTCLLPCMRGARLGCRRRRYANSDTQIKYSELPQFAEVMAAGTAAALVPIRSITRRMDASSPQSLAQSASEHPRVAIKDGEETITYIPDSQEASGPLALKLLTQLKAIQLGKVEDKFGWCFKVEEADGKKVMPARSPESNSNGQTVDQLD